MVLVHEGGVGRGSAGRGGAGRGSEECSHAPFCVAPQIQLPGLQNEASSQGQMEN